MMLTQIIGSKGRSALFSTLFDGKHRCLHIREIARANNLSAPSLMREAKELVRLGILRQAQDGNRINYSANESSPLYKILLQLVSKTNGPEARLKHVFEQCDAPIVFIYGSRANGTARTDSDFDIFVIGNEGLRGVTAMMHEVSNEIDAELNPFVITPEEFSRRVRNRDHFIMDVLSSEKKFLKGDEDELGRMA